MSWPRARCRRELAVPTEEAMCALSSFQAKYKLLDQIGEGSFSQVLRCRDRQGGALYAVKRLRRIYQSVAEVLESAEVMAARLLPRHPNVLCVLETYHEALPGRVSLVFELMDMSLYELMRRRRGRLMAEARVRGYVWQLLRGLDHLHRHGLFHRDVKPENVLLRASALKIADLGSVRGPGARAPFTPYISTRWYRSPECLLTGGFYGSKMDIWAAGCVFYELLSLQPLFPGENELDQIARIHGLLGSPHPRLIAKFRRYTDPSSAVDLCFPMREARGLGTLLPRLSGPGLEALQLMLVYDPDARAPAATLLEHRYFADLRLRQAVKQTRSSALPGACALAVSTSARPARVVESSPSARAPARLEDLRQSHAGRYFLRKRPNNLRPRERLHPELRRQTRDERGAAAARASFFLHEERAVKANQLPSIFVKPNVQIVTSTYILDNAIPSLPSRKPSSIRSPVTKLPRRDEGRRRQGVIQ